MILRPDKKIRKYANTKDIDEKTYQDIKSN